MLYSHSKTPEGTSVHILSYLLVSMQLIPGTEDNYRHNYWGYSTVGFFAPMARYSQAAAQGKGGQDVVKEFKTMVKECHKRGIEVLMDVVFNHTAEGNERGPTLSFRYCVVYVSNVFSNRDNSMHTSQSVTGFVQDAAFLHAEVHFVPLSAPRSMSTWLTRQPVTRCKMQPSNVL